jgi:hypothetical protein
MNLTVKDIPKIILYVGVCVAIMVMAPNFTGISILLLSLMVFSLIVWGVSQTLRRQHANVCLNI